MLIYICSSGIKKQHFFFIFIQGIKTQIYDKTLLSTSQMMRVFQRSRFRDNKRHHGLQSLEQILSRPRRWAKAGSSMSRNLSWGAEIFHRASLGLRLALLLPLLCSIAVVWLAAAKHQELSVRTGRVRGTTWCGDQAALLLQILKSKTKLMKRLCRGVNGAEAWS